MVNGIMRYFARMRHAARLNFALKIALLLALLGAAWYQVFHQRNLAEVLSQVDSPWRREALPALFLVLLLVPVNWGLEAEKWRRLIRPVQRLGFLSAFGAVMTGITLGLFTPNRVGEYGGRLLHLRPRNRWPGVSFSLVGSYAQILVTLWVGTACGWIYARQHATWSALLDPWVFPALLILLALALPAFFTLPLWAPKLAFSWLPGRVRAYIRALSKLGSKDLIWAFFLSALRYSAFTAQFLVLLKVYGIILPVREGITAVGTIFLVQSVLPSFAAVELLKRGNIALLVFGVYTASELGVLATSSTLWLINLVFPALLGYVLILRRDFFRSRTIGNKHAQRRLSVFQRHHTGHAGSKGPSTRRQSPDGNP